MKKIFVLFMAAFMVVGFFGTANAATARDKTLANESGVSFAQTPVISGGVSGETLYVVSGAFASGDITAATGVSVWEVSPVLRNDSIVRNVAMGFGFGDNGYAPGTGVTVSPSSPVLIDNGTGGNSIFFTVNNFDAGVGGGVTGFSVIGMSADSLGRKVVSMRFENSVTGMAVAGPLAWTDKGLKGSKLSGTSLFFAAADSEYGGPTVGGVSVYSINTAGTGTHFSTDLANTVNGVLVTGVSAFFAGPAISENVTGVSVYFVGQSALTGVSLYCFNGGAIDGQRVPGLSVPDLNGWVIGPHQAGVQNLVNAAIPIFGTPAIGKGSFAAGEQIYSGNSLFVVDGVGGVSVFNKNTGAFQYAVTYGRRTAAPVALPFTYPGPVTNGRYLVLCSDAGVTVYGSGANNDLDPANPSSCVWSEEFNKANGFTENYRIYSTPVISEGKVIVALGSADGFGNERKGPGQVYVFSLSTGNCVGEWPLAQSAVASPIVSDGLVWIPEYTSSIYRISFGADIVNGYGYWRQFKFDAAKTGENTAPSHPAEEAGSSGGCFISTIK